MGSAYFYYKLGSVCRNLFYNLPKGWNEVGRGCDSSRGSQQRLFQPCFGLTALGVVTGWSKLLKAAFQLVVMLGVSSLPNLIFPLGKVGRLWNDGKRGKPRAEFLLIRRCELSTE